ncbi:MAG: hypothetical protein LBD58_02200, partial [Treponema sp.]|nr:hypothetical protein [Treponema sp.]
LPAARLHRPLPRKRAPPGGRFDLRPVNKAVFHLDAAFRSRHLRRGRENRFRRFPQRIFPREPFGALKSGFRPPESRVSGALSRAASAGMRDERTSAAIAA